MAQRTVRVEQETLEVLRELAREDDEAMPATVTKAVEAYRRMRFIERINAGYADLRADRKAWRDFQRESAPLEQTLADGLERETRSSALRVRRRRR